jgi:signal peptidase I
MSSNKPRSTLREYVEAALWALVLTLFLRAFVIQAFRIPSESMRDTLLVGDFLFVNKFEYGPKIPFTHIRLPGLRAPRTGDVIVFQYPEDPSKDFIKRCIATGGQTVEVRNKVVYLNDKPSPAADALARHVEAALQPCSPYAEPYPDDPAIRKCRDNFGPLQVRPGRLFMMGDNRENSNDSRFWGTVPMDYVKGRAMFIYWSWDGARSWPRWNRIFQIIH